MSTLVQDSWGEPPRDLKPGARLGAELVVTRVLGYGGTAVVYEARHTALELDVAVKVCGVDTEVPGESRARLLREARVYEHVRDPRLPRVYAVEQLEDGTAFMAMEKLEGITLSTLLDQGPLSIERACQITIELLDALGEVHRHGVVHRDVKPANVILTPAGSLFLIDFGVCKAGPEVGGVAITRSGEILGTPAYMAPEQLTAGAVDHRVDIHAAGLILFELLTGESPYGHGSFGEIVAAVLRDEMPAVKALRPDVPDGIASVVTRATAKQPCGRFPTALAMRDALAAALHEDASGAPLEVEVGPTEALPAQMGHEAEECLPESVVRTVPHTRCRGVRRAHGRHDAGISPQSNGRVARQFV
jgi:serine/threonine protein kinase